MLVGLVQLALYVICSCFSFSFVESEQIPSWEHTCVLSLHSGLPWFPKLLPMSLCQFSSAPNNRHFTWLFSSLLRALHFCCVFPLQLCFENLVLLLGNCYGTRTSCHGTFHKPLIFHNLSAFWLTLGFVVLSDKINLPGLICLCANTDSLLSFQI